MQSKKAMIPDANLFFEHVFQLPDEFHMTKREIKDKQGTIDQINPLSKNDPARADVRSI